MKLRYLIIFAFIQTTALAGCEWKNTNELYKDYIHEDEGDGNGGHIVPCPGFFHPAVEGVTPAYYELSSGRCYKTEDLENFKDAIKGQKLISFEEIKTLQSLQDYRICEIYRSEPEYYFDQEESPAKLTYIGEYKGIENFFNDNQNYEYNLSDSKDNKFYKPDCNKDECNQKYKTASELQICPNDYPVCTVYFLKEQNVRVHLESFFENDKSVKCKDNTYCHLQNLDNEDKDEIDQYYTEQKFDRSHRFYEFICTNKDKLEIKNECGNNEINCDGFCIDPHNNPYYCGAEGKCNNSTPGENNFKGVACDKYEECIDGKCEFNPGIMICKDRQDDRIESYVDPSSNNTFCGAKGKCNSDDEESEDFRGFECNTPAEQCLEGKCVFVSCEEETNKKLCTINGKSDCTDITTFEHCGSCFQPCYHPQTDSVDVSCKETIIDDLEDYECAYQCKDGYVRDELAVDSSALVCIHKSFVCETEEDCKEGKKCVNGECIGQSEDGKCPDDDGKLVPQDFHHCGENCLDCQRLHGVSGDCINGKCVITECETGFHLYDINEDNDKDKEFRCILNTASSCGSVTSTTPKDCYSYEYYTDTNSNLKTYNCIDGECQVSGCTDNANMFVEDGVIRCEPNNELNSCGPQAVDCETIDHNLDINGSFTCSHYQSLILFNNNFNANLCQLIEKDKKPYCEAMSTTEQSYHNSANNQSCRLNTHYECGPRHEKCKANEICAFDSDRLKEYRCMQKGSTPLNQCKEGDFCQDMFNSSNSDNECISNICQDPKINDLNCYKEDGIAINCVALRNKIYHDIENYKLDNMNTLDEINDVPTGSCEYNPDLMVNLSSPFDPNPVIQTGNWHCACPNGKVFCHSLPYTRIHNAFDIYKDDNNIDISGTDFGCYTVKECNDNIKNNTTQPEPEG